MKYQKETNYLVSSKRRRPDLNWWWRCCRPLPYHLATTPQVTPTGFEPMLPPWKGGVLTTWPRSQTPRVGLEPTTARLTAACSTDWAIEEYNQVSYPENHTHYIIFLWNLQALLSISNNSLRSSYRPISNSQLHTSLCFHLCPIYLIVSKGSLTLSSLDISSWGGLHA